MGSDKYFGVAVIFSFEADGTFCFVTDVELGFEIGEDALGCVTDGTFCFVIGGSLCFETDGSLLLELSFPSSVYILS